MPNSKGLVLSNQANDTVGKHIHNFSTFKDSLSYRVANTLRFGDYTPSFDMEGVENDNVSLNSLDRIDSLSLKAPFKGSVRKIKESFKVPNMAILPMQWDRIYAQPSNGDDVPKDANCIIKDFPNRCKTLFENAYGLVRGQLAAWSADTSVVTFSDFHVFFTALLRTFVLGEYMFSAGSLLHVSGYRYLSGALEIYYRGDGHNYDDWFDQIIYSFFSQVDHIALFPTSGNPSSFEGLSRPENDPPRSGYQSFRALLEAFRENPLSTVQVFFDSALTAPDVADVLVQYLGSGEILDSNNFYWIMPDSTNQDLGSDVTALNPTTLNLSRLLAYQLVCAHFYTNSSIDFIYSAELYRQYIRSLFLSGGSNAKNVDYSCFSWNGHTLEYDYLSGHVLDAALFTNSYHNAYSSRLIEGFGSSIANLGASISVGYPASVQLNIFAVWPAIFGFRKSLRYGDYFTGSRPRPLAPVNTDVSVNSNMVSVVDITRNIQAQRFANAVMRSRSKIEEYVKALFGKAPAPDFHNPFYLSRETELIYGDEVQNTGSSQELNANSRTSNFVSNVGQYTFTFHNDDMHPCIYLQIISFDIRRVYTRSVDRQMLHIDRFDMFNPDFQYIGDQPVYGVELGYNDGSGQIAEVFGYQSRDMEYKQRFDVASGGFAAGQLPGWLLTDKDRSRVAVANLDPDFIRSYNTEFDQFFLALTGFSLGTYFHFVCITSNNVDARRAMAVDPQILA